MEIPSRDGPTTLCLAIHARLQATFEVNFASGRPSHIYLIIVLYTGQWCDCLRHDFESGCGFAGIDVSGLTFYIPDKDEHESEQLQDEKQLQDGTSSDGGDSYTDEVCQPLQDTPHLQTPTRGTQHHQPLQDAPHSQTPTRGTQRCQPL